MFTCCSTGWSMLWKVERRRPRCVDERGNLAAGEIAELYARASRAPYAFQDVVPHSMTRRVDAETADEDVEEDALQASSCSERRGAMRRSRTWARG